MKIVAVIPARYESSRFQGKPLADIKGKPMIWWTYQQAKKVKEISDVYVATDDKRIFDCCEEYGINVVMTSNEHLTGTDRVAEVARKVQADIYINIQGDEPLIEPDTIRSVLPPIMNDNNIKIVNLMSKIKNPVDVVNTTIPKVITNNNNKALFLTRAATPYPKGAIDFDYYKQVCVYAFTRETLEFYSEYGKKYGKSKNERIEDIEILRFLDNGFEVQFVEVETRSVAVDTKKDLERVCNILECKEETGEL